MRKEQGIEAMILACTESPLLFGDTKACTDFRYDGFAYSSPH
ncbi:hypothetical protein [Helicobacter sp.]|nr:hypothetical protein [Helicobacter sp.]